MGARTRVRDWAGVDGGGGRFLPVLLSMPSLVNRSIEHAEFGESTWELIARVRRAMWLGGGKGWIIYRKGAKAQIMVGQKNAQGLDNLI